MASGTSASSLIGPVVKATDWGFPGHLTQQQFNALTEFKKMAAVLFPKDRLMEDRHLLRYLRARDFNLQKTFNMLKFDLEWRREFEGLTFKRSDFPSLMQFFEKGALYRSGSDKDGRPVIVSRLSMVFPREVQDASELTRSWVAYVHMLNLECEKAGVTDYTAVADLSGFSPSKNFSLAFTKQLIEILQNFYPERLAYALVIHVPITFRALWGLVAPFLEERTKEKVHLLGSNLKLLQDYIPENQLEKEFGGNHPGWPRPDHIAQLFDGEGVTVNTGFFAESDIPRDDESATVVSHAADGKKSELKKKMSAGRIARVREIMASRLTGTLGGSKSPAKTGGGEAMMTAKDVPKTAPRLALFGASGKTGMEVAKRASAAGWDVACFVRVDGNGVPAALLQLQQKNPDRFQIVIGDVHDPNDLDRVIETSDAVVSCIGAPKSVSGDSGFFVTTAEKICAAMERNGTKRLIVVTAAQAKRMSKAWYDTNATVAENANRALFWGGHYKYIGDMEKLIEGRSAIDWTFIRPAALADGPEDTYQIEKDTFWCGGEPVSRNGLANFIVKECVIEGKYVKTGVAIAAKDKL